MSAPVNNGGPAFPNSVWADQGMYLRDWFAGQALAGICSTLTDAVEIDTGLMARDSYDIADAMLAARDAKP